MEVELKDYRLPESLEFLGGVRRPGSIMVKDGEIKLCYEADGSDFAVVCIDLVDGQTALVTAKGDHIDFTLGEQLFVAYNRKTGELTRLTFGISQNITGALAGGFLVGGDCLGQLNEMEAEGLDIKVVVDFQSEEPSLTFYEVTGAQVDDLGKLELVYNPIGAVGGHEYLFKWQGASPLVGIAMEVVVWDDLLSFVFTNEVDEEITFDLVRYFDMKLVSGIDWDVARVGEVFEAVSPDCFS